ncbi:TauD/TfdA family dioxygenase [Pseudomonas brassicacearum]|uniref:TauD/TfdA family dioxygenase n=1 Tax=Pseudomonas brassicacearum TaxID=930166 RepID=UPI0016176C42|nr:TauD/TfdA family dioxygenase [Pseudomonas brassicacearum]
MSEIEKYNFWEPSHGASSLLDTFHEHGIVLFKRVKSSNDFLSRFSTLGEIYRHNDYLPSGLTHITYGYENKDKEPVNAANTNKLGFTQGALIPHTDRSGLPVPPRLLAFWVEQQSGVGGSSLFSDGHRIFEKLSAYSPNVIEILTRPKSVVFKSETGFFEGSILYVEEGKLSIRFRFDRMVYLSPDVASVIQLFLDTIKSEMITVRLAENEGYLIDNHRWLHGRTHYSGARSAYRLLLNEVLKNEQ